MLRVLLFVLLVNWTPTDILNLLQDRADYWGASYNELYRVVSCETGGTFSPYKTGSMGEKGAGQWLPGNAAWKSTPFYKQYGIHIVDMYIANDPDSIYFDVDMLAWSFSPQARGMKTQWSCY